jgi:hypothetical protein
MAKKLMVVFGIIVFEDSIATIKEVEKIRHLPAEHAECIAKGYVLDNVYDAYVIPELYEGDIITPEWRV